MASNPRRIALEILHAIDKKGIRADQLLGKGFKNYPELNPREKAFITELVYGVLRWRNRIDWIISNFVTTSRRSTSRLLTNLIRLGTYQVLYLTNVPVPVSVSETVEIAKELFNGKIANLVNGVLRSIEREQHSLPEPFLKNNPVQAIAIQFSHPDWLVKKWIEQYGVETTISLCKANNTAPDLIIRTNTLKLTREELLNHLEKIGLSGEPTKYSPEGIKVYHPSD
ncbi:MAG: 16S rRNA (cytosine(967)-C(5))-methyltransferase RsmB, partial [Desulfobacterota bacterium]|nr:16S rRNA (cytosine(967)-C(5))-methyltransferase RsmB [Thermodesulfobacteriota bacterium]